MGEKIQAAAYHGARTVHHSWMLPTFCCSLFLSSAVAELADRPRNMLITLLTALSNPKSGTGELCLVEEGEFLGLDRLAVIGGFINSAGDSMIWRSLTEDAASASILGVTSVSGEAFSLVWEVPCTNWAWNGKIRYQFSGLDRLAVIGGFISSAGDSMIWRSLMEDAASASILAVTSVSGEACVRGSLC